MYDFSKLGTAIQKSLELIKKGREFLDNKS